MQFKYTAISRDGAKVTGVVEGYNELDAASRIRETCDVILKLTSIPEKKGSFFTMELGGNTLDSKAFTVMCNQFSIILKSGIPISRTVRLIAGTTTNKPLRNILHNVADDVESGRTLSAAFADHGGTLLPVTFIETIRAGEESGSLDRSFSAMAMYFDNQSKTHAQVRNALAYPAFVLALAIVVVIVLMIVVVPKFTQIFEDTGGSLPLLTRMLFDISDFFRDSILVIIAVVAALILTMKLYGNTEDGRINLAKCKLKIPLLGNIQQLNAASQFSNTMAAMLGAGIPIQKAVSITAKVIDNYYISTETGKLVENLEAGETLGTSMRDKNLYPDILVDMTIVGEATGEIEDTLVTIAQFYDAELENATKTALAKLEPALLIGVAVVAGFVVIAMYMAMFRIYDSM